LRANEGKVRALHDILDEDKNVGIAHTEFNPETKNLNVVDIRAHGVDSPLGPSHTAAKANYASLTQITPNHHWPGQLCRRPVVGRGLCLVRLRPGQQGSSEHSNGGQSYWRNAGAD